MESDEKNPHSKTPREKKVQSFDAFTAVMALGALLLFFLCGFAVICGVKQPQTIKSSAQTAGNIAVSPTYECLGNTSCVPSVTQSPEPTCIPRPANCDDFSCGTSIPGGARYCRPSIAPETVTAETPTVTSIQIDTPVTIPANNQTQQKYAPNDFLQALIDFLTDFINILKSLLTQDGNQGANIVPTLEITGNIPVPTNVQSSTPEPSASTATEVIPTITTGERVISLTEITSNATITLNFGSILYVPYIQNGACITLVNIRLPQPTMLKPIKGDTPDIRFQVNSRGGTETLSFQITQCAGTDATSQITTGKITIIAQ